MLVAFPTRTIGQLIECLLGKLVTLSGSIGALTSTGTPQCNVTFSPVRRRDSVHGCDCGQHFQAAAQVGGR